MEQRKSDTEVKDAMPQAITLPLFTVWGLLLCGALALGFTAEIVAVLVILGIILLWFGW